VTLWLLMVSVVLGLVSVVCAVIALRSGNRVAIRIDAAALIVNAVLDVPGFFLHGVSPGIKVLSAALVLGTVLAVVLMLRRDRGRVTVNDCPPPLGDRHRLAS
jgi:ABC-type arginine/histidine transport system permease subunit